MRLAVQGSEVGKGPIKGAWAKVGDDVRQFSEGDLAGIDPILDAGESRLSAQLVQHFGRNVERDHIYAGFGERDRLKSSPATQLEHLLPCMVERSETAQGNPSEMKVERVPLDNPIVLWC
jgi:hypothetical protein